MCSVSKSNVSCEDVSIWHQMAKCLTAGYPAHTSCRETKSGLFKLSIFRPGRLLVYDWYVPACSDANREVLPKRLLWLSNVSSVVVALPLRVCYGWKLASSIISCCLYAWCLTRGLRVTGYAWSMSSLKFVSERDLGCLPAFQPVFLATSGFTALALELMIMSTCCVYSYSQFYLHLRLHLSFGHWIYNVTVMGCCLAMLECWTFWVLPLVLIIAYFVQCIVN